LLAVKPEQRMELPVGKERTLDGHLQAPLDHIAVTLVDSV